MKNLSFFIDNQCSLEQILVLKEKISRVLSRIQI